MVACRRRVRADRRRSGCPSASRRGAVLRRTEGFELVGEAADGEEAVELAGRAASRPGADGHQHAGHQRHRGHPPDRRRAPDTMVFLCSTYQRSDLPPEAETSGFAAYVNKEELAPDLLRRLWEERSAG